MDRVGGFRGEVCKEGNSLKIYIPVSVAQYLGIMAGDDLDVKVMGHYKKPNSGSTPGGV